MFKIKLIENVTIFIFQILCGVTLHGMTRSKELVDLFKRLGVVISYKDILDLYAAWTAFDARKVRLFKIKFL